METGEQSFESSFYLSYVFLAVCSWVDHFASLSLSFTSVEKANDSFLARFLCMNQDKLSSVPGYTSVGDCCHW